MYKINIDRKQKNRSPPSQNILNIFLSQRHLIIARLNVMIVDSNYLPSKSWSFEKKRRFVNQSICIWWSHLSFADKVCRQRHPRRFDDFFDDFFASFSVSGGNFALPKPPPLTEFSARRHPRKIHADGTIRRHLRLEKII